MLQKLSEVIREIGLHGWDRQFRMGQNAQKSVDIMQSGDFGVDSQYQSLTASWFGALGSRQGMFFAALARQLFVGVPLYSAVGIASGYMPGGIYGNGLPAVLSRMTFSRDRLEPKLALGLCVVTLESIQAVDAAAQQSLEDAASMGVIYSVDGDIYNEISGSSYPGALASGSSAADATKDMRGAQLAVLAPGQPSSRAFWVCNPRTAIALATCSTTTGALAFPDVSATGGSLLGLAVLVSPAWGDGLSLVDGSQVAAAALGLAIDASRNSTYSASLDPTQNAGLGSGPEQLVSGFQSGAVSFRTMTRYSWATARESACYTIGGSEAYGS